MAIDEALLNSCDRGLSQSTLRLYDWISPTLSLGCFQRVNTMIEHCSREGIPFVRRITGGRAVLHANEITYAVVCSEKDWLFGEGISGAYRIINKCLLEALKDFGIDARMHASGARYRGSQRVSCFHFPSRYEIILNGKKLAGSAQRRFKKAFLQHGSILFGIDRGLVSRLFGEESIERMSWLGQYGNIKKDEFRTVLTEKIRQSLNIQFIPGCITDDEISMRDELIEEKYKDPVWNINSSEEADEMV